MRQGLFFCATVPKVLRPLRPFVDLISYELANWHPESTSRVHYFHPSTLRSEDDMNWFLRFLLSFRLLLITFISQTVYFYLSALSSMCPFHWQGYYIDWQVEDRPVICDALQLILQKTESRWCIYLFSTKCNESCILCAFAIFFPPHKLWLEHNDYAAVWEWRRELSNLAVRARKVYTNTAVRYSLQLFLVYRDRLGAGHRPTDGGKKKAKGLLWNESSF